MITSSKMNSKLHKALIKQTMIKNINIKCGIKWFQNLSIYSHFTNNKYHRCTQKITKENRQKKQKK